MNVSRASSTSEPESKLPTATVRLLGAAAPPDGGVTSAMTSAQMTYEVKPALPPPLCATLHPIARPLESRAGTLDARKEPALVVPPPPPIANLPVGHIADGPFAWIVMTFAIPGAPVGPVGPAGPAGP